MNEYPILLIKVPLINQPGHIENRALCLLQLTEDEYVLSYYLENEEQYLYLHYYSNQSQAFDDFSLYMQSFVSHYADLINYYKRQVDHLKRENKQQTDSLKRKIKKLKTQIK